MGCNQSIRLLYGVTVGDDGKDTVVRGVWIRNRGLSALCIAAYTIPD